MTFEVYRTTAENIVGATDAALQKQDGVNDQLVADFLDTTLDYARDALLMATELSLLSEDPTGTFVVASPCAIYLCTASRANKAAILRYVLEQYPPYRTFKVRLKLTGIVGEAATQTRAIHNINAHRWVVDNIGVQSTHFYL